MSKKSEKTSKRKYYYRRKPHSDEKIRCKMPERKKVSASAIRKKKYKKKSRKEK